MENKKVLENLRKICVVLIVIWMIVVFIFSHQTGEGSSGLSSKIAEFLFKNEQLAEKMEAFIRKGAHMAEYEAGATLFDSYCVTYPHETLQQLRHNGLHRLRQVDRRGLSHNGRSVCTA